MSLSILLQMKDELMMAKIRDAEHGQFIAELTQKVSLLELKVSVRFNITDTLNHLLDRYPE